MGQMYYASNDLTDNKFMVDDEAFKPLRLRQPRFPAVVTVHLRYIRYAYEAPATRLCSMSAPALPGSFTAALPPASYE